MSIKYVDEWPRVIGMTANPTAEQCRAAGYELTANKPQDVIDAEQAAIEQAAQEQAAKYLKSVMDRAETAGVQGKSYAVSNFNVADGIVQAAAEHGCDLIFIGSHGRSGLSRLLLGSVTAKVLSLAQTAVLVYRVKEEKKPA